jgi:NitT/TauT family transport system substrate-binding protein
MKNNRLKSTIGILFLSLFFFGIASNSLAGNLRMAGSDWPVWETARGMSALNQTDNFAYSYEKYATCINGFVQGKYDITFMTLYDFIATQRENPNGVIIAATDYSSGGDGVVLRKNISSASALKGKKLGLQADAISLYVAHLYLSKNGLSLNDIKISNVKGEFVSKAFVANKSLAGIVGWNPNLDDAIAAGHLAATSADFPENVFDVIVVNRESLEKNRAAYLDLLKKWFTAVSDSAVTKKNASLLGVSENEFNAWLGDASIYKDAEGSLNSFHRMKQVAGEIQSFYKTKPISLKGNAASLFGDKSLDIDKLFDDSLLKELK